MPFFRLGPDPIFPPPDLAEPEGLLAIGGDLSAERLMAAYRQRDLPLVRGRRADPLVVSGPSAGPLPRRAADLAAAPPDDPPGPVRDPLRHRVRPGHPGLRRDASRSTRTAPGSRRRCSGPTSACTSWATPTAWRAGATGELVGGIYGVRVGRCFCGESMFHHETDASKVALAALVERLKPEGVDLIDCQVTSEHLLSLGAREIPRAEFLRHLKSGLKAASPRVAQGVGRGSDHLRRPGSLGLSRIPISSCRIHPRARS